MVWAPAEAGRSARRRPYTFAKQRVATLRAVGETEVSTAGLAGELKRESRGPCEEIVRPGVPRAGPTARRRAGGIDQWVRRCPKVAGQLARPAAGMAQALRVLDSARPAPGQAQ